jgi:pyridoxal 5'-phosphate synthase pdxS subunit
VPADIRAMGRCRMSDPVDSALRMQLIPVMAKCRIGHFVEAQIPLDRSGLTIGSVDPCR